MAGSSGDRQASEPAAEHAGVTHRDTYKIPAVQVLGQAWEQQYRRDGQEVRGREGRDLPPGRDRDSWGG